MNLLLNAMDHNRAHLFPDTGKEGEELLHEVAARYVEGMKDMEGRKPGPSSIHGKNLARSTW